MGTSVTIGFTRDSLGIFWEGEEVPGITIYGYYSPATLQEPQFPTEAWPPGTSWSPWKLHGENWIIWVWDIRVDQWPRNDQWRETIEITLGVVRTSGARVAWCGVNGIFAEPPHLFDPARMSGGVWAALDAGGILHGPPSLRSPFETLSDDELLELQRQVRLPHV